MPLVVKAALDLGVLHRQKMWMVLLYLRFCGSHSNTRRHYIAPILALTAVKHIFILGVVDLTQLILHLLLYPLLLLRPLISVLFSILSLLEPPHFC